MSNRKELTRNHARLYRLIETVGIITTEQAATYTGLSERKIRELFKRWHGERFIVFDKIVGIAALSQALMDQMTDQIAILQSLWVYITWMKRKGCNGIYRSIKPYVAYYFDDSAGDFYEVIVPNEGSEFLAQSYMAIWKDEDGSEKERRKRIVVLSNAAQVRHFSGLADLFCFVSQDGTVKFFVEDSHV